MKSQVPVFFNDWLTLMETAFSTLTKEEFRELEEKIKKEIAFHRSRKRPKNTPRMFSQNSSRTSSPDWDRDTGNGFNERGYAAGLGIYHDPMG
jgi:hypothetical protein